MTSSSFKVLSAMRQPLGAVIQVVGQSGTRGTLRTIGDAARFINANLPEERAARPDATRVTEMLSRVAESPSQTNTINAAVAVAEFLRTEGFLE